MNVRVTQIRPADWNHQVVTVEGGKGLYRKVPCGGCPWRCDNVGEFPAEAFRQSAHTAYDMSQETFGCHESGSEKPAMCAGFLLRGADNNLSIRLKLMKKKLRMDDISDGGHELYDSYAAMAIANGVDADEDVLRGCR